MTPVTGFHCVIDSPDSVSRVAPPTITIAKISAAVSTEPAAHQPRPARRARVAPAKPVERHGPFRSIVLPRM